MRLSDTKDPQQTDKNKNKPNGSTLCPCPYLFYAQQHHATLQLLNIYSIFK